MAKGAASKSTAKSTPSKTSRWGGISIPTQNTLSRATPQAYRGDTSSEYFSPRPAMYIGDLGRSRHITDMMIGYANKLRSEQSRLLEDAKPKRDPYLERVPDAYFTPAGRGQNYSRN